jgi:hypothetical protein
MVVRSGNGRDRYEVAAIGDKLQALGQYYAGSSPFITAFLLMWRDVWNHERARWVCRF